MSATKNNKATSMKRLLPIALAAVGALVVTHTQAAVPGITGPTFNLVAGPAFITQPDGQAIYSWGYGCDGGKPQPGFKPTAMTSPSCGTMQIPGPTLIVTEGDTVTVNLVNNLPTPAGNSSILFPGFTLTSVCPTAQQGLLTCEAAPGTSVQYKFVAGSPGTRAYYSGTQGDLQIEMGLYGAIIVLPKNPPAICNSSITNLYGKPDWATANHIQGAPEFDFRLAHAAMDNPNTCYDREYLFQFSEMDPSIHYAALAQVQANPHGSALQVPTEPYHPAYYMINGRSMPDDMDANYAPHYPHQPYNGNPHMHPGEVTLLRIIGQGRWQHPFHEHANHVRVLARDGNMLLSATDPNALAGPLLFTTTTTPGQAMDGLFYYTGKGLNWDMYAHNPSSTDANAKLSCTPDANGYNTGNSAALNYYEWCQDHDKPLQAAPFGDVPAGGPVSLPDPNIFTNGTWYGGSPYFGPDATTRATFGTPGQGTTGSTPASGTIANDPSTEAGFAFMWHSHNEREITTNNIFPGGMMMMMLVDSREFVIDENL